MNYGVRITGYALVALFIFSLLITSDWLLARYISSRVTSVNTEASAREKHRAVEDDRYRSKAIEEGFTSMLFPSLFDSPPFLALVKKHRIAPLAPQPYRNLYYCNEGYGLIRYRTDRFGFRNPDTVWTKDIDIVLIGDSFAQGACVDEPQSIAGSLSKKFNIANLATGGNDPIHYAALAKVFLQDFVPKYAVMVFYSNDNIDDTSSVVRETYIDKDTSYFDQTSYVGGRPQRVTRALSDLYKEAEALINVSGDYLATPPLAVPARAAPSAADSVRDYSNIVGQFRSALIRYSALPTTREIIGQAVRSYRGALPRSSKLAIDTMVQRCSAIGCRPIFVYIPCSEYWRPDPRAIGYVAALRKYVSEVGNKALFLDTSAELSALGMLRKDRTSQPRAME